MDSRRVVDWPKDRIVVGTQHRVRKGRFRGLTLLGHAIAV